ncbi:MAG: hypothetical protein DBX49_05585 [Clostridia bacterium]|nr:MAG: hypothetical protein DBX49_05585 [Clostridia bacterium]
MNVREILGVKFVNAGIMETVENGMRLMEERKNAYVAALGTEQLQAARRDGRLMEAVRGAELILPQGSGILCASHILGLPLKGRISALDFASALMARMSEKGMSIFIVGPDTELVELAEEKIKSRYPGIIAAGSDGGFCTSEIELTAMINQAAPDLLLVALGSPRQELWMHRCRGKLKAGLMLGFGEELKALAGELVIAPKRWRDSGFEWLYWLIKEPWRIPRMLRRTGLIFTALWRRLVG